MRHIPLIAWLFLWCPLTAFAQDVLEVNFQGVDPALQSPWTSTTYLAPNLSFSGLDFGAGAFASPGFNDVYAFHLTAASIDTSLQDAIRDEEYLSFTLAPTTGFLDLGGKDLVFSIERGNYWSPVTYSVFTSIDGFASGQEIFTTPSFGNTDYNETRFLFTIPTTGYNSVTGPVEFRLVAFGARYNHDLSLTELSITDPGPIYSPDMLDVDFRGTNPALNTPWTATTALQPNLSFAGVDLGLGCFPTPGFQDVFAFHLAAPAIETTLRDAVLADEYLSFSLAPTSGVMNLGGQKIQFSIQRTDHWAPAVYSLFSSIDGFTVGKELFSTEAVERTDYTENDFGFIFPPSGYDGITSSVEFRLVAHSAKYNHDTTLTKLSIIDPGPVYSLTLGAQYGGQVRSNPYGSYFETGSAVQLIADPNDGFRFSGWTGDVVGRGNPRTVILDRNLMITGNFESVPLPNMELGMNLGAVRDFGPKFDFVDIMETARPWLTRDFFSGLWDSGFGDEIPMDQNGWPTHLPFTASDGNLHYVHTLLALRSAGTYTVEVEGSGRFELIAGQTRQTYNPTGGSSTYTFVVPVPDAVNNMFLMLEESSAADPITSLRVIRPGFASVVATQPFHPDYLAGLAPFSSVRFMNWGEINNSLVTSWADHVSKDHYSQATLRGASLQYMAEFANATHADPWICIPHMADDNYVREAARLLRDNVDPSLKIYVEYSNETWNGSFQQTGYAEDQGLLLGLSTDRWEAGQRYVSLRSVQIWTIFEQEFVNNNRLVKVLGTHSVLIGTTQTRLDALNDPEINPNYVMLDALAIAPYFGHSIKPEEIPPIAPSYPTVDDLLDVVGPSSIQEVKLEVRSQKLAALRQGAELICYEGGQHYVGLNQTRDDQILTDILVAVNRDPRIGELYRTYLDMLQSEGVSVFSHFTYIGAWNKFGSWGSKESQEQPISLAHKYRALVDWQTPVLKVGNLIPGQTGDFEISRCTPGGPVTWGFSATGGGPTQIGIGELLLTAPFFLMPRMQAGSDGIVRTTQALPPGLTGARVWYHAFDVDSQSFSNGLTFLLP
ncbi:MAG: hypothetical protein QM477_08690 [Planctomycetota bacterium]